MTAAEAFYRFWGQFGFPVSEEGAVPDTDPPVTIVTASPS